MDKFKNFLSFPVQKVKQLRNLLDNNPTYNYAALGGCITWSLIFIIVGFLKACGSKKIPPIMLLPLIFQCGYFYFIILHKPIPNAISTHITSRHFLMFLSLGALTVTVWAFTVFYMTINLQALGYTLFLFTALLILKKYNFNNQFSLNIAFSNSAEPTDKIVMAWLIIGFTLTGLLGPIISAAMSHKKDCPSHDNKNTSSGNRGDVSGVHASDLFSKPLVQINQCGNNNQHENDKRVCCHYSDKYEMVTDSKTCINHNDSQGIVDISNCNPPPKSP